MSNLLDSVDSLLLSPFGLALVLFGAPLVVLTYRAARYLASPLFSPIRKLNGPPSKDYLMGHFKDLVNGNAYKTLTAYKEQYGDVFAIKAILGVSAFVSTVYLGFILIGDCLF